MAIRTALGARRSRLIRQMITESVTLAIIGGVWESSWACSPAGLSATSTCMPIFPFTLRSTSIGASFYSFAVAVLAGVVVGVAPALRIAKGNVNTVLHEGGRGVTGGRHRLRDGLVVLQIAGSLVMLVVAALFIRSLSAMQTMDFGFKPDHVLNVAIDSNEIGMTDVEARDWPSALPPVSISLPVSTMPATPVPFRSDTSTAAATA